MSDATAPKQRKIKQIDMREHIRKRSMWAGSKNTQDTETYVLTELPKDAEEAKEYGFVLEKLKYPPALAKMFDEILVNVIDHYVENPKLVTRIVISLTTDGCISVFNNGPGLTIEQCTNTSGQTMYTPQMAFSECLAGSNLDDTEETERIVGGQNGIGAKIASAWSTVFTVETTDEQAKLHYRQTFRDGLQQIDPPEIIELGSAAGKKLAILSASSFVSCLLISLEN